MKIRHRVGAPRQEVPPSHVETDPAYLAELEATRIKAERAFQAAQRRVRRAEEVARNHPDPQLEAAEARARAFLAQREDELAAIEKMMRAPSGRPHRIAQRSGQEDRLELGRYEDSKRTGRKPGKNKRH